MRFRPRRALTLLACALILGLAARSDGPAVFVSRISWTIDDPRFGGWSGLEVTGDGHMFTAVADRGWISQGRLHRTASGRLAAVTAAEMRRLDDTDDGFFRTETRDAEGLAIADDGRVFVAFEAVRRVVSYPDANGHAAEVLPIYRDFIAMHPNRSLESLAIDRGGALYMVPEAAQGDGAYPVYRFDGHSWAVFARLPDQRDGFRPVGADIGPGGRLYLLERRVVARVGFASRVRRFDLTESGLSNEKRLLTTRLGTHDNLEGLAVWKDATGQMRLTLISDDNFGRWQATEVVEYVVREAEE